MNRNPEAQVPTKPGILDRFVSREYAVPLICICLLVSALFAGFSHGQEIHLPQIAWMWGVTLAIEIAYLWLIPEPSTWLLKAFGFRGLLGQTVVATLASAAIALGVSFSSLRALPEAEYYSTDRGVHRRIPLSDGSTVDLNTQSRMKVTYSRSMRSVELLQGEAFFTVSHDAHRPFKVKVDGSVVEAIGTAFGVRLRAESMVDVAVETGVVAIDLQDDVECALARRDRSRFLLTAHMEVRITRSECVVKPVSPDAIERNLAWKRGQLRFEGETLEDAAAEFNRYNSVQLEVDPRIAAHRMGGTFRPTDVGSFVQAMERAGVVQATRRESDPGASQPAIIRLTPGPKADDSR